MEISGRVYLVVNKHDSNEIYGFMSYTDAVSFCLNSHFQNQIFDIKDVPIFKNDKEAMTHSKTLSA